MWWLARIIFVTAAFAGALPLCGPSDDSFQGVWKAERQSIAADVSEYCPASLAAIRRDYQRGYICEKNRTYDVKTHVPSACRVLSLESAAPALTACLGGGANIAFVGDSLVKQQYWAFRCELERVAARTSGGQHVPWPSSTLTASFFDSHHLRSHMPCFPACATNKTYRAQNSQATRNGACVACNPADGKPVKALPTTQEPWFTTLPNTTRALVVGSGTWWNTERAGANESRLYRAMLSTVAPALNELTTRGIAVLWLDIPPQGASAMEKSSYGWKHFGTKNEEARRKLSVFAPHVIFLNTTAATAARRMSAPNTVTTAGLHWCSPGNGTVTAFITQHVVHILLAACQSQR